MEDAIEVVEELATKNRVGLFVAIGATAGVVLGYFVGYRTAIKILEPKYASRADEEIKEAKAFYATLHKQGNFATPEKAAEALIPESVEAAADALALYQGNDKDDEKNYDHIGDDQIPPFVVGGPAIIETETVATNLFERSQSDFVWDHEAEVARRDTAAPYVLHEEEWSDSLPGYTRVTLTYYEGDSTLADEKDEAIPDIDGTVGLASLQRFGEGTEDSRTVFVRNERLTIDFEILLHDGKYAHEVLGFQHGERLVMRDQRRHLTRFRGDDE